MSRSTHVLIATSLLLVAGEGFSQTPVTSVAPPASSKVAAKKINKKLTMTNAHQNPLLQESSLPYHMPAFDKIKDQDFGPAFEEGIRQHRAEIEAIANNLAAPSFDNTIVALEKSGRTLRRAQSVFFNLNNLITNDAMQKLERELAPKLAAHDDAISLNPKLFARIAALHEQRASLQLDAESLRLLEKYHRDFVHSGAKLGLEQQTRLKKLNLDLAELNTRFNQNVLKEVNADALIVNDKAELAGLSEEQIKAMAVAAKERGQEGKYLLSLDNTTTQPANASLENRALRERLHTASINRGAHGSEFDNRALILQQAKLRAERAQLLGFPNYAALGLQDETAGTPQAVNQLLAELTPPAVANARKEAQAIQKMIDLDKAGFQLAAHDWDVYAEKVRKAKYKFDESQLKPYFELHNVMKNGVFFAATQLYGITFTLRPDLPKYHPDIEIYEVKEADGKPLALFIVDYYARPTKRGGAWMNEYVSQSTLLETKPVVGNHLNIPKPAKGTPSLLTTDEVVTLFHEFGHALHGMLSNVRYPTFAGTNVPRDFVEYPSQVNEMWIWWPEVLKNYAKHYQTGAAMPPALLEKLLASKKFNQGYATTEYLAASILDQAWHQLTPEQIPSDVLAFEAQALQQAGIAFAPVPPRYRSTYFSHSFGGGYAAGYYAYLWSEKLDADTGEWFAEQGGMTRKNGDWFRQKLLSKGGSVDAMELYTAFRGRAAQIKPLLERRGLDASVN